MDEYEIYNRGVNALEKNRIPEAIQCFSRIVQLVPSYAPVHSLLAMAYAKSGRYADAAHRFREYKRLETDKTDEDFADYVDVLEQASNLDVPAANELIESYMQREEKSSSHATIAGRTILIDELLDVADELIFSRKFSADSTVRKFVGAMKEEIPARFYDQMGLTRLGLPQALGFAYAFTATGYAIAKASKRLLGHSSYMEHLPDEMVERLQSQEYQEMAPTEYNMYAMRTGNPISWNMVRRAIDTLIEARLKNFLDKAPWAKSKSEMIREHLVKEFILRGYYMGLWENAGKQNSARTPCAAKQK